jgi:hypothetical protein
MRPNDLLLFWNLITKDYTFVGFVVSLVGLFSAAFFNVSIPDVLIFALLSFTSYDAIGYESVAHSEDRTNLVRYRICQTGYQWVIALVVGILTHGSIWAVGGYIFLWWIGVCDLLFYALLNRFSEIYTYGNMPWLWWTPLGIINKILGRDTTGRDLTIVCVIGTVIWFSLWFLFPSIQNWTF